MAGLLDFLNTPAGQGLLSAAAGGLAGARRGTPLNNIGRGLLAGAAGYSQGLDRQTQEQQLAMQQRERDQMNELRNLQMSQARMGLEREQGQQAWRQGLPDVMKQATEASYGASDVGPTMTPANPDALKQYAMLPNSPFADEILKQNIMPKESSYKTVGSTMIRIGPNGEVIPVFSEPPKPDAAPSSVREYEYAKGQGFQGTYEQYQKEMKRAGASSTNVSVNATKPFINEFGAGLGKAMSDARTNAQGAVSTIGTVQRLNEALDAGVMAGPGTSFRQFGLQIGSMLGVAGKDAEEKLLNTRAAIQSLAQLELDAAQQMKGQGQITEAERSIIRRAASGDIDSMTAGELRVLGGVLDRTARSKIEAYNAQIEPLMSAPETAGIAPFLRVNPPEMPKPKGPVPSVVRKPQGQAGAPKFLGFEE
jgi:hypothetical protein